MRRLFISDLHLSEERPAANERFFSFVEEEARGAGVLYILGDFFEYWIGDDDLADPFNGVIAGFLRRLTAEGTAVHLMHGNRDFLIGERFCRETGAKLLADPTVMAGVLLMHGDTLCTDDLDYQAWRRKARSREFQAEFGAKSLDERRLAIKGLREKSKEVIQAKPAEIMDVNEEAVKDAFRRHGVRTMIHGHTHRPGRHVHLVDGKRCERWVLPDWYGRGGYLELSEGRLQLVRWK
ncbi:MAG: UDP-2,3-diacylglucosamine diphosphatase [Betaproteobacteria bacterium]